eukprot:564805-Ditylum_brightwellii.AAC.1
MTGIIQRSLIQLSERRKTNHKGQVGGRTGHDANTLTFLQKITTDITRCSRKPLVNVDNNAASCYDGIIPHLANLIGKKKGLH